MLQFDWDFGIRVSFTLSAMLFSSLSPTMAPLHSERSVGLEYVRLVQAKLLEDDRQTYDRFCHVLKQFRLGEVSSSDAVATVHKLFRNYPDLVVAFRPFVPPSCASSAAAAAKESDLRAASADFLNRVRARFDGNGVYRKFVDCMGYYSRRELTISEVCDEVVGLLGEHRDLAAEFASFLPEFSRVRIRTPRKRKVNIRGNYDDQETPAAAAPTTTPRECRNPGNFQDKEEGHRKQQEIINSHAEEDFEMEDKLCRVEVEIKNLISTLRNAGKLLRHLYRDGGRARRVNIKEHFTALNLGCLKRAYGARWFTKLEKELGSENGGSALHELMNRLEKKKKTLKKSRMEIQKKWVDIRKSRG